MEGTRIKVVVTETEEMVEVEVKVEGATTTREITTTKMTLPTTPNVHLSEKGIQRRPDTSFYSVETSVWHVGRWVISARGAQRGEHYGVASTTR